MTTSTYRVMRQDDAGNQFVVETGLSKQDADALVEKYEAKGHKQTYWAELETTDSRKR